MSPAIICKLGHDWLIFKLASCRFNKTIVARRMAIALALTAVSMLGQQKPPSPTPTAGIEFPVLMEHKIAAGKTRVGTKVDAKLIIATLVKGQVIPEGAIMSGEVTESAVKSATLPSRLGVRMDSAQWKNGSIPIRVYLTAWYYPVAMPDQEQQSGVSDGPMLPAGNASSRTPRNHHPIVAPGSDADAAPPRAASILQHRILMKNVEIARNSDGAVTLTSKHSNLKLDKGITYVLAADGLLPAK
ncbi:MAG: hypothetical protein WAU58_15570 [Terriglobales bacterium]